MMSIVLAAGLVAALAQASFEPPAPARGDSLVISATVGRGRTWDDEGIIGNGVSAGGSLEWRFHPRWSAVARVERLGHERHIAGDALVFTGRTVFATAEIKYLFGSGRVVPFLDGGYGAAIYSGNVTDRLGPVLTRHRTSRSGTAIASGGVEVKVGRFLVMPDIRLFMCQPHDEFAPWAAIRAGVSAGWRF